MHRPHPLVFINYRDRDQPWAATMLDRELSRLLGNDAVFLDSKSLPFGLPFDESLLEAVRRSSVLLAVIGERWLAHDDYQRLVDRRHDWVRREIAAAFVAGTIVIPVLVGDIPALIPDELPLSIRRLARCQALRLRHRDCGPDLDRLVMIVSQLVTQLGSATDSATEGEGEIRRVHYTLDDVNCIEQT
jgi:hypothetical protein